MTSAVYVRVVMVFPQACGWEWSGIIRTEESMMGAMRACATSAAGAHGNFSGSLQVTLRSADLCVFLSPDTWRAARSCGPRRPASAWVTWRLWSGATRRSRRSRRETSWRSPAEPSWWWASMTSSSSRSEVALVQLWSVSSALGTEVCLCLRVEKLTEVGLRRCEVSGPGPRDEIRNATPRILLWELADHDTLTRAREASLTASARRSVSGSLWEPAELMGDCGGRHRAAGVSAGAAAQVNAHSANKN